MRGVSYEAVSIILQVADNEADAMQLAAFGKHS